MTKEDLFTLTPRPKLNVLPENPDAQACGRFPRWLHRPLSKGGGKQLTHSIVKENRLPTVCEEAKCPNLNECWSKKSATFLALGKQCTRNCGFCDIDFTHTPPPLNLEEPQKIANSVAALGLKHVVITMVARDDLNLGGAPQIASILNAIHKSSPKTTIEVLTSDFEGNTQALDLVLQAAPQIFNHNIETVERLSNRVRHKATYIRSLQVLSYVNENFPDVISKSGLMLGLGETPEEVLQSLKDLFTCGCKIVTLGQYLQPNRKKLRVKAFITPQQFQEYAQFGRDLGLVVYAGPFVRSSYNAKEVFDSLKNKPPKDHE